MAVKTSQSADRRSWRGGGGGGSDQTYELRVQAEGGDAAQAQAALGTLLWAEDQREALHHLRLAAAQGHAATSYRLDAAT